MDRFSGLPLELLLHITYYVLPAELEAFAQVSKRTSELVKPLLARHRALVRRHRVYCNDAGYSTLPVVLTAIAEDPLLGHYIRHFELTNKLSNVFKSVRHLTATEFDRVLLMLHENKFLESSSDAENRIKVDSAWRRGDEFGGFLLILFLSNLPNLERITFLSLGVDYISVLGEMSRKAARNGISILPNIRAFTFEIGCEGLHRVATLRDLIDSRAFGSNPVMNLEIWRSSRCPESFPEHGTCKVQNIKINEITPPKGQHTSSVLKYFGLVENFTYDGGWGAPQMESNLLPIIESLLATSKSTLKTLTIIINDSTVYIDAIREFLALETLSIPCQVLTDNHKAFLSSLPGTLVTLSIFYSATWHDRHACFERVKHYFDVAKSALELKSEQKFRLATIRFVVTWDTFSQYFSDICLGEKGQGHTINKEEEFLQLECAHHNGVTNIGRITSTQVDHYFNRFLVAENVCKVYSRQHSGLESVE